MTKKREIVLSFLVHYGTRMGVLLSLPDRGCGYPSAVSATLMPIRVEEHGCVERKVDCVVDMELLGLIMRQRSTKRVAKHRLR